MDSLSRRRTSYADRKDDLRWFDCRALFCGGTRAGEEFRDPEDRRQAGFVTLPSLPAGARRIMEAVAMRGDGREGTNAAEVYNARRTNALNKPMIGWRPDRTIA
jgi:hypothetical protein